MKHYIRQLFNNITVFFSISITSVIAAIIALTLITTSVSSNIGRGAGVVPYAIIKDDSNERRIVFLLAKDAHRPYFSGFGGNAQATELFEEAASREAHEETMGVLSGTHGDPKNPDLYKHGVNFFKKRIDQHPIMIFRELERNSREKQKQIFRYAMYFIDVSDIVKKYKGLQNITSSLDATKNRLAKIKKYPYEYLEKTEFKWFSIGKIWQDVKKLYKHQPYTGKFYFQFLAGLRHGEIAIKKENGYKTIIEKIGTDQKKFEHFKEILMKKLYKKRKRRNKRKTGK